MKRNLSLSFFILCTILLTLFFTGCSNSSSNHSTKIDSSTSFNPGKEIGLTTAPHGAAANNDALTIETSKLEKYTFRWKVDNDKNTYLTLVDKRGAAVLVLQDPYAKTHSQYYITEYQLKNPNFKIWTLTDTEGSNHNNSGYWVIGEYNGKIVKFLDRSNLKTLIADNELRQHLFVEALKDGLQITMTNTDKAIADNEHQTDVVPVKIFWDNSANWFGMRYGTSD